MALTAQGKKSVGRKKVEQPLLQPVDVPATHNHEKQAHVKMKDTETSTPRVSSMATLAAVALLLARGALDTEQPFCNTSTLTALVVFLMIGAVVMSFDYIDAVKEEAKKRGSPSFSQVIGGCCCLIVGCCVAIVTVFALVWGQGNIDPVFMEDMLLQTTHLMNMLISAIPVPHVDYVISDATAGMVLSIFVILGSVIMRIDFVEAAEEEARKQNLESSISMIPSGPGGVILGCGSVLALASALVSYSEELSCDAAIFTALVLFMAAGIVVMRSDFQDAVQEVVRKEQSEYNQQISESHFRFHCIMLGWFVGLLLASAVVWARGFTPFRDEMDSRVASLKYACCLALERLLVLTDEPLCDTATWTVLVVFLVIGAVMMRLDYIEAVKEETAREGVPSKDHMSLMPIRCCLFLASAVAISGALAVDELMGPLFMRGLNLKDALPVGVAMLLDRSDGLLGDRFTLTSLVSFLFLGAAAMRHDYVEAVREEAEKQGLSKVEVSFMPAKRWCLSLGSVLVLAVALALSKHGHIWEELPDEAPIFLLSLVLVIALPATFFAVGLTLASRHLTDDLPKSPVAMK